MSAIAKAAAYLTEHGVSSISPGMGMFLVRVTDGVKAARAALWREGRCRVEEAEAHFVRTCPPGVCKVQSPQECTCLITVGEALALAGPLEEYEKALNTISIMACHQQVAVIGVLQAALKKGGAR